MVEVGRVDVRKGRGRQPLEARDVCSLRIEAVAHPPRCQAVGEALTAAKGCGGIEMLAGKLSHFCANVIRHGDEPACRRRIGGRRKLLGLGEATFSATLDPLANRSELGWEHMCEFWLVSGVPRTIKK